MLGVEIVVYTAINGTAGDNGETSFTFRLYDDGHTDKAYTDFLRVLALRRYQFRVTSKYVSSASVKMFVHVKNYRG